MEKAPTGFFFRSNFVALNTNNVTLPDTHKFHYFKEALTDEARDLESPNDTFESLSDNLRKKYEIKRIIVKNHRASQPQKSFQAKSNALLTSKKKFQCPMCDKAHFLNQYRDSNPERKAIFFFPTTNFDDNEMGHFRSASCLHQSVFP
jgi:hypothetical protein